MEKILANTVYSDSTLKSWNKENLIELIRILENNWANAENSLNIQAKNCEMLLKEKQEEFNSLKKDYIELDLECRNLWTELDKELTEHEEFTKKANSLIELQKENIEKTHKNNMELREEIESLKSKSSFKNSWKNKFFKAQEEVERLTKENERLSDLEFTQEHCDLYKENEYLKSCLVLAKRQAVKETAEEFVSLLEERCKGIVGYEYSFGNIRNVIEKICKEITGGDK